MEKQQLSVDDDLLPIYYVHSEVEDTTLARTWQEHNASLPSQHFNHLPTFKESSMPPGPSTNEVSVLKKCDHEGQKVAKNFDSISGTNVEDCSSSSYSSAQVSGLTPSHKATSIRASTNSTSKNLSAQDVFLASLLQVQLCMMDLEDHIEITETNHKAREMALTTSPTMGLQTSPPFVLESKISPPCTEDVLMDSESHCVDEDQESDDNDCSEPEVEDESLFCNNPLFKNSEMSHNVEHKVQTSIAEMTSHPKPAPAPMDRILNDGSQVIKPNAWESKDFGTRPTLWHQIIREDSLEELQIYEDEWEEKRSAFCRTRNISWPVPDNLSCIQEIPVRLEEPPTQIAEILPHPYTPATLAPCKAEPVGDDGLLFSDTTYWTQLLISDESEHQDPPTSRQESTPPPQEKPTEKFFIDLNQSKDTLPQQETPREEFLVHLNQGKDTSAQQETPREEFPIDLKQGKDTSPQQETHREEFLIDLNQGKDTSPQQETPREEFLIDLNQGKNTSPQQETTRGEFIDLNQGKDTSLRQEAPREEFPIDLRQGEDAPFQEETTEEILLDLCQGADTGPLKGKPREEVLLELCQVESSHPVCQGCQGKEHGSKSGEMESSLKHDNPEIFIEQLDDVSTDFETSGSEEATYVEAVANAQDVEAARCLALKLFHLDGFDRSQVAPYLQKNNDFSAMVAEEYLAHFDFKGKTLDVALRSLLQELVLTGETQERERVLYHFSKRFHSCNPNEYSSADAVHTLTCAIMLLNSDLHGQNIGKSMTAQDFINNLEGMNDGGNFPRDLLKGLYHSIRVEKLEWAMSEEKLAAVLVAKPDNLLSVRKKSNPFVDLPAPDPQAPVYKQGMLCRKVHADIDGKKTPWGKRRWKSFNTVLKGMLLLFLKDEYKMDFMFPEEVISVHHALAEKASDYTKRPNVFRLQTADWRVFLFQAQTSEEMNSWISRINLVAAMFSSPPFAAAVGSQRRFYRPFLPSAQSKLDLEEQLQSHESLMDRFTDELTEHQRNLPDPKSKSRDSEDYHLREEYLRYEKLRYETYVKLLAMRLESGSDDLQAFESRLKEADGGQVETPGLKRSYSSPSLKPESSPVAVKVKRNISERRTYRRIIPKRNKNLV